MSLPVSNNKSKSLPMTNMAFRTKVAMLSFVGIIGGLTAGLVPEGAGWRFFSYHPLFVSCGLFCSA